MDNITKFLLKLSPKEQTKILNIFQKIKANNLEALALKKLSGFTNTYRVRFGRCRIVFVKKETKNKIINVSFRKDAYK